MLAFEGHTGNVTGVGWHCEGKWLVTSSEDGTVKIWDTRTATVQRNYSHPGGFAVNDVVIHPNQGELISVDRGGNVRIWDLGQSKCTHHIVPEEDVSISSVTVATDGSMLCVGNNRVGSVLSSFAAIPLDRHLQVTPREANLRLEIGQRLCLENAPRP